LAVAASCGFTPKVAGAEAPAAGAVVWAEALTTTTASRAPKEIDLTERFMVIAFIQYFREHENRAWVPAIAS
jgi:phosphoribosylformylglycinamidine (FGAM) synthase-like enzyme